MADTIKQIWNMNLVDSEMRSASAGFATTGELDDLAQIVANFGSYTTANGIGEDNHPDVEEPNKKTIYLVKDDSITTGDAYKEWICTNTTTPTYELIGDTQVDLSNYYLKTQTSGAQEIQDALDLKQDSIARVGGSGPLFGNNMKYRFAPEGGTNLNLQEYDSSTDNWTDIGVIVTKEDKGPNKILKTNDINILQWITPDYYTKSETSGKQEIQDALDLKQNIWSSATISTLTTSYDIANNTVTKLENNNISDILEFNITGLSADEVPNVSVEFINNQADCYPVFKNNNVELFCNTDTCYSGKSYMFRALGSMSEIIEMRTPRTNVSVNGTDVSVNGNLITP